MYDEKRPSDGGSSASVQDGDRKDQTNCAAMESIGSEHAEIPAHPGGSPVQSRQGYCSCCQVHYMNLEKHLASDQHRQLSVCKRNRVSGSMMMERFLQDVHLYHPQNYHDTRPTYDDIPEVDALSSSREDQWCILSPPQTQTNKGTVSNIAKAELDKNCVFGPHSSKDNSKKMAFTQTCNKNPERGPCPTNENPQQRILACNSTLTIGQEPSSTAVDTGPHSSPFSLSPFFLPSPLTANRIGSSEPPRVLCLESNKNKHAKHGKGIKYPCPNMTTSPTSAIKNRQFNFHGSCCNPTSGTSFGKESVFKCRERTEAILRDCALANKIKQTGTVGEGSNHIQHKGIHLLSSDKSLVDDVIETVIWKYCHEPSSKRSSEKDDKSISSLIVKSILSCSEGSSLSFEWNVPTQLGEDTPKVVIPNLDVLKESSVKVDEDYKSKLKCVLNGDPESDATAIKSEHNEEVLPALNHVPPSFVGKTWSQIMYEDDLKVEALVKQFRKGKFHCYFEDGHLMNVGSKRRHKNVETEKKDEVQTDDWTESQKVDVLPLFEDDPCEDHLSNTHSIKSERLQKPKHPKPCRRTWRQTSRCQVVKVSHGTQTSVVNFPVIKKKFLKDQPQPSVFDDFGEERTPDMKTRMCALKLPESYTKILTPLQPNTMVYVLSHPDIKPGICKAACISSRGRNRYSTDSRDSAYYKYKQSPLKYYDPLTNRILKTPPRSSARSLGSNASCVRKLFRSLSSEGNVAKVEFGQKKSSTSKKSLSSCSVASLRSESAKANDLHSSTNGGGSSVSTDCKDSACVKVSGHPEKPYAHFSLSPSNGGCILVKEDIQQSSKRTQSLKTLRPKKMIRRESPNSSARKEPRAASQCKDNPQRMVKNLGKRAQAKKRPRRTSTSPKSTRRFVQVCRPNQKTCTRRSNEQAVGEQRTRVNSQLVALKPAKRNSSQTNRASNNNAQNGRRDKSVNRAQSKASDVIVRNIIHHLRSRRITTTTAANSRPRRKVT
ncbi:DBF4-type zinc finger-containing protein 2 isoform X2 [Pseudophryne corroboree]